MPSSYPPSFVMPNAEFTGSVSDPVEHLIGQFSRDCHLVFRPCICTPDVRKANQGLLRGGNGPEYAPVEEHGVTLGTLFPSVPYL